MNLPTTENEFIKKKYFCDLRKGILVSKLSNFKKSDADGVIGVPGSNVKFLPNPKT